MRAIDRIGRRTRRTAVVVCFSAVLVTATCGSASALTIDGSYFSTTALQAAGHPEIKIGWRFDGYVNPLGWMAGQLAQTHTSLPRGMQFNAALAKCQVNQFLIDGCPASTLAGRMVAEISGRKLPGDPGPAQMDINAVANVYVVDPMTSADVMTLGAVVTASGFPPLFLAQRVALDRQRIPFAGDNSEDILTEYPSTWTLSNGSATYQLAILSLDFQYFRSASNELLIYNTPTCDSQSAQMSAVDQYGNVGGPLTVSHQATGCASVPQSWSGDYSPAQSAANFAPGFAVHVDRSPATVEISAIDRIELKFTGFDIDTGALPVSTCPITNILDGTYPSVCSGAMVGTASMNYELLGPPFLSTGSVYRISDGPAPQFAVIVDNTLTGYHAMYRAVARQQDGDVILSLDGAPSDPSAPFKASMLYWRDFEVAFAPSALWLRQVSAICPDPTPAGTGLMSVTPWSVYPSGSSTSQPFAQC